MELIAVGFLLGVVFSLVVFGAGAIYGNCKESDQGKLHTDIPGDLSIPGGDGSRSSYNRCTEQDIREHARKLGIKLEEGAKKRA